MEAVMGNGENDQPSGMTDLVNAFQRAGVSRIYGAATAARTRPKAA
jgi:hypothetical protein